MTDSELFMSGLALIDDVYVELEQAQVNPKSDVIRQAMNRLCTGLNQICLKVPPDLWKEFTKIARQHKIMELLCQDPCTQHALNKPRGYAGDATLLDYWYFQLILPNNKITPLGKEIHNFIRATQSAYAVRTRAEYIGKWLDKKVDKIYKNSNCERGSIRVLALASGHVREASTSHNFFKQKYTLVAFDQDKNSLKTTRDEFASCSDLITINASIGKILKKDGLESLGKFDLIYSAGLFDYLNDEVSTKLLTILTSELLNPSGSMIIANAMSHHGLRGYMESFMGWNLIHRDADGMNNLAAKLPKESIKEKKILRHFNNSVVYLEITKNSTEDLDFTLCHDPKELKTIIPRAKL